LSAIFDGKISDFMTQYQTGGKLFIFSAPSGSGKTSIVKAILQKSPFLDFSISCTTRPPRADEMDGKDYHFISVEQFQQLIRDDAFAEWEMVYEGRYYGTLKSEIQRIHYTGKHVVFDVDVEGGLNLKKLYGLDALAFFIKPPSLAVLEERLRARNTESEDMLRIRLEKARKELAYASYFDMVILNDKLEEAVEEALKHIQAFLS